MKWKFGVPADIPRWMLVEKSVYGIKQSCVVEHFYRHNNGIVWRSRVIFEWDMSEPEKELIHGYQKLMEAKLQVSGYMAINGTAQAVNVADLSNFQFDSSISDNDFINITGALAQIATNAFSSGIIDQANANLSSIEISIDWSLAGKDVAGYAKINNEAENRTGIIMT